MKISYAKTVYGQNEINAVVECLNKSTQMGHYARIFESKIAKLFDKNECLYVNSGSSALYIGVEAFGFKKGSEVITPALTFSTSVGCLVKNDLVPVFVDVEPLTYCIDHNQIEKMITEKILLLLENKKLRESMGANGKLRANENYAWDKKIIEYLDASK